MINLSPPSTGTVCCTVFVRLPYFDLIECKAIGHVNVGVIYLVLLEIPNDAYTCLRQFLICRALLSQEYCKLISRYWIIDTLRNHVPWNLREFCVYYKGDIR